jgi:hypothetical protein
MLGTLRDEYDIYVACLEGTGEYIKTFDEWLGGESSEEKSNRKIREFGLRYGSSSRDLRVK